MTRMYRDVATWNVWKGCLFDCVYCRPSFQAINKRITSCKLCQDYVPHFHEERLSKIPRARTIFVAANGDISLAHPQAMLDILTAMDIHSRKYPETEYYLQSKDPRFFDPYLDDLPKSTILITTLETNYDHDYARYSNAPPPRKRWHDFKDLKWDRKIITIEPIMDFDMKEFLRMLIDINPMKIWIGYNSRPKAVQLPEPSLAKTEKLIRLLRENMIEVEEKDMRR